MSNILIIILKCWLYFFISTIIISRGVPYHIEMGFHHKSPFGWTTKSCPSHLACVTSQGLEAVLYWHLHQIKVAFISFISHLLIILTTKALLSLSLTTLNVRFSDKDLLIIQVLSTGTHASSLSVLLVISLVYETKSSAL